MPKMWRFLIPLVASIVIHAGLSILVACSICRARADGILQAAWICSSAGYAHIMFFFFIYPPVILCTIIAIIWWLIRERKKRRNGE